MQAVAFRSRFLEYKSLSFALEGKCGRDGSGERLNSQTSCRELSLIRPFPVGPTNNPPSNHSQKKSYSRVAQAVIKGLTDGYSRTGGHTLFERSEGNSQWWKALFAD